MRLIVTLAGSILSSLQPEQRREVEGYLKAVEERLNTAQMVEQRARIVNDLMVFGRARIDA